METNQLFVKVHWLL